MTLTPTRSRKGSPVQNRRAADSPLRAAGDAESQFFACACSARQALPYRLTCDPVANLRLRFCDRGTVLRFHAQAPVCMYRRGQPRDLHQARRREQCGIPKPAQPVSVPPARVSAPSGARVDHQGAHCTVRPWRILPKNLTFALCNSDDRTSTDPRRVRDRPFAPPVNPHLIDKSAAKADGEGAPEKSHRNLRGFKNPNVLRYLSANCECADLWRTPPEKPHLSCAGIRTTIACQVPKNLTCDKKRPAQIVSPSSIGGLFSRSGRPAPP